MWVKDYMETILCAQFCCAPKPNLKNSLFKNKRKQNKIMNSKAFYVTGIENLPAAKGYGNSPLLYKLVCALTSKYAILMTHSLQLKKLFL